MENQQNQQTFEVQLLMQIRDNTQSIKGWVVFFGILLIISCCIGFFALLLS
ncbi:hypothetical protein ES702_04422 [subsurface metagenome]